MIPLARVALAKGEVLVARRRGDGAVGYWKHGRLQTLVDTAGCSAADFIAAAVDLIAKTMPDRVLVLGYGGGVASTLLESRGLDVVSVDRDACARGLATRFFGAPPRAQVVTADALAFVRTADPETFGGVFVDFQDSPVTPTAYLSADFWRDVARLLRRDGAAVLNATEWLWNGQDVDLWRQAFAKGGLALRSVSEPYRSGHRLVSLSAR